MCLLYRSPFANGREKVVSSRVACYREVRFQNFKVLQIRLVTLNLNNCWLQYLKILKSYFSIHKMPAIIFLGGNIHSGRKCKGAILRFLR
jgi:hypothetical protein